MQDDIDEGIKRGTRAFIARVADRYAVKGVILFGSRARRSHHPYSDTDVAVLFEGVRDEFLATKLALADIAYDVLLDTGVYIQPLPIWKNEWEHPEESSNPELIQAIGREGVRL